MRVLYIYNSNDAQEVELLERVKQEFSQNVDSIEVIDFMEAKEIYKISQTPALIVIREDYQGQELLTDDLETGKLRATGLLAKNLQEQNVSIGATPGNRIEEVIKQEVDRKYGVEKQKLKGDISIFAKDLIKVKLNK